MMATDRQASSIVSRRHICLSGFRKLLRCVVDHRIIEKSIDGPQADRVHDGVWVTREGNLTRMLPRQRSLSSSVPFFPRIACSRSSSSE